MCGWDQGISLPLFFKKYVFNCTSLSLFLLLAIPSYSPLNPSYRLSAFDDYCYTHACIWWWCGEGELFSLRDEPLVGCPM